MPEEVMEKPTADNTPEPVETPEEGAETAAEGAEEKPVAEEVKPVEPEPVKKPNHDDRRWNRLLQERAEYKAKAELYERQQTQAQQADPDSGRPAREKFADDESYVDALTDWKITQKLGPMQAKMAEQQQQSRQDVEWDAKLAVAKKEYADFDDVLADAQEVPVSQAMAQAIKGSNMGADLVYFLGKDPEYASKIARMDPVSAIREIGRIESYIEYDKTNKKPAVKVSKAPAPIKPVNSSSSPGSKNIEDMTPAEYIAYRNKQVGKRK